MKEFEKNFLDRIIRKFNQAQWYGWAENGQKNRYSYYFNYGEKKKNYYEVRVLGLKTILPQSLFKVEIRFAYLSDFDEDEKPNLKSRNILHIKVIDPLARFDKKEIINLVLTEDGEMKKSLSDKFFELSTIAIGEKKFFLKIFWI